MLAEVKEDEDVEDRGRREGNKDPEVVEDETVGFVVDVHPALF